MLLLVCVCVVMRADLMLMLQCVVRCIALSSSPVFRVAVFAVAL